MHVELNQLGHAGNLHARVRLDQLGEILLQQFVVEVGYVRLHNQIVRQLRLERLPNQVETRAHMPTKRERERRDGKEQGRMMAPKDKKVCQHDVRRTKTPKG
jgi:hypothetical protein